MDQHELFGSARWVEEGYSVGGEVHNVTLGCPFFGFLQTIVSGEDVSVDFVQDFGHEIVR
jgi:hypothetical protein